LNRFSDDQDSVDTQVPAAIGSVFSIVFSLGGSVITVFVITRYLGLIFFPLAYLYYRYMTLFLSAAREIQRYQSISKSPILSHLSECLEGLYLIRAFGADSLTHITSAHELSLNTYLRVSSTVALGSAWFSLRIQLLGSFFILTISLTLFLGYHLHSVSPNLIALALSYTLSISDDFMSFVMIWSWCEQLMISPERILQYIQIEPEGGEVNKRLFRDDEDLNLEDYDGTGSQGGESGGTMRGATQQLSTYLASRTSRESAPGDESAESLLPLLSSQKKKLSTDDSAPPPPLSLAHWPSNGVIEFHHVYFKYQPTSREYVLSDLHFTTRRHEKIGIVGRTGAGKSSLTMSLFRIAEVASGRICVDGVDISELDLKTLRQAITIIPQAPVLFKGTLRNYLDPFEEYSDDEMIWRVLKKTHVAEIIQQMMMMTKTRGGAGAGSHTSSSPPSSSSSPSPTSPEVARVVEGTTPRGTLGVHVSIMTEPSPSQCLNFELAENGENFSLGQRQLLVLSRALLRDVRVLIMDEATASMDHRTDQQIQQILREEFKDSTVLTIAHRLETIIDCDRVLVLSNGEDLPVSFLTLPNTICLSLSLSVYLSLSPGTLLEDDSPQNLLANPFSSFRKLAEEAKIIFPVDK
jgi:ABC-type multidrug transport system fused ATPase/permease subunit